MNRNQKIALGCGGAGCLGLIVVVVAASVIYLSYQRRPSSSNRNYNFNVSANRNSNFNSNSNDNSSSASSMSNDNKHKLFQAAGMTKDTELMQRVLIKIGFRSGTGSEYQQFVKEHLRWAFKNLDFIQSVDSPEKARAYVDEHIND
jgi:hypothetical protein